MTYHLQTAAVVFVLTRYLLRDTDRCLEYCRQQGYRFVGLIADDWAAAIELTRSGEAQVIVVADPEHVDPDRTPRVEFVAHQMPQGAGPAGPRPGAAPRTHIVRRQTEEE